MQMIRSLVSSLFDRASRLTGACVLILAAVVPGTGQAQGYGSATGTIGTATNQAETSTTQMQQASSALGFQDQTGPVQLRQSVTPATSRRATPEQPDAVMQPPLPYQPGDFERYVQAQAQATNLFSWSSIR